MKKINTWLNIDADSDFSIYNLPFGIFSTSQKSPRIGVAIGDKILDLAAVARLGHFDQLKIDTSVFKSSTLNDYINLGKSKTKRVRTRIQKLLSSKTSPIRDKPRLLISQSSAQMHLPVEIGDYTDFYSSIEHATNLGIMFRGPENALMPNWRHIPVGYHGRSSSITVSGTPFKRPHGQVMPPNATKPKYQPTARLDFELEMGFVIGKQSKLGQPITTDEADDHIFGMVLFNDWSARDIQKWEYVPLGPFLGKNFFSSISPWIVTMEALETFKVKGPTQKPAVLPYLKYQGLRNYDISLDVLIKPKSGTETIVSRSNFKYMYWNMAQQLAHHTVNGCNVNTGDIMASGTISGKDPNSYGSMLEISKNGTQAVTLNNGEERKFILDGDTVIMRGRAQKDGIKVGFGEVRNLVRS